MHLVESFHSADQPYKKGDDADATNGPGARGNVVNVPSKSEARQTLRWRQDRIREQAYREQEPLNGLFKHLVNPATLANAFDRLNGRYGERVHGTERRSFKQIERLVGRETFITQLSQDLRAGRYRPQPLRRIGIGNREAFDSAVQDRVVQYALTTIMGPLMEASSHPQSFGWQAGLSPAQAIRFIKNVGGRCDWAITVDIKDFFRSVPHRFVIRAVRQLVDDDQVIDLIRKWLKQSDLERQGIVTGTIMATPLANIVLTQIDNLFPSSSHVRSPHDGRPDWFRSRGHKGLAGLLYVRYADDLVVLGKSGQVQPIQVLKLLDVKLQQIGLDISWKKSGICDDLSIGSFDFLAHRVYKRVVGGKGRIVTEPTTRRVEEIVEQLSALVEPTLAKTQVSSSDDKALAAQIESYLRPRLQYYKSTKSDLSRLRSCVEASFVSIWEAGAVAPENRGTPIPSEFCHQPVASSPDRT